MTRTLIWDGLENVRDLGGLATEDGSRTRYRAIVRADNVRRLGDPQTLVDYGITRIVDLRFAAERHGDAVDAPPVEVAHVSLLGEWDDKYAVALEADMAGAAPAEYLRWSYLDFLARFRANFGVAVSLIADAPPGVVCVHCVGGRDRTGLVSALVLRLAGVSAADVGRDYAESEPRLAESTARWVAEAADERQRAYRLAFMHAPAVVMERVIEAIEGDHGSVRGYLLAAGVEAAALDRLRARLRV